MIFPRIKRFKHDVFNVVADGAISLPGIGEGRFIPAVIINPITNKSISDMIKLHQTTPPGDTLMTWSTPLIGNEYVVLNFEFTKPLIVQFGIKFDIKSQGMLVDGIIQSRGLYLCIGTIYDKVSDLSVDRILIDVPNLGFDKKWNNIIYNSLSKKYRKDGFSTKQAREAAKKQLKNSRDFLHMRRN
ncbi:hypothetical protein K3G63_03735 [Hymenobacter sp. HSC-4F20]|uniref:hypothetical protein n=1 Tax=Hymenobacter sp. HSC-4F20 TaxID=2864135 RepID=UPI001C731C1D|nr:hypothetical protein [Hymenobacter sp. HSC-4F20]MBX0289532.1 hypothetical protein [Hymenobacter sp. HSC-4F20]